MKYIYFVLLFIWVFFSAKAGEATVSLQLASGGKVEGTLVVPEVAAPCPVVLIIAGSGPTDRDGNNNMGLKTDAYKQLSQQLLQHGIASLRYDKRAIGASKLVNASESDLRFENYIDDAKAWVDMLSKDNRFSRIILAGHSEGSLIALAAAQNNPKVAGLISLEGAGRPADEILKEQLQTLPSDIKDYAYSVIDKLKKGETEPNVPSQYAMLFRASVQPYMISWFKYDPAALMAKLRIPVLIVQGTTDLQVTMTDAEKLTDALPKATFEMVQDMNHVLKNCKSKEQAEQMATYRDASLPLNEDLVKSVVAFVNPK
jgi:pimeloyl-ACP methyl ester carboxylesterase